MKTLTLCNPSIPAYFSSMDFTPAVSTQKKPIQLQSLLTITDWQDEINWKPFRKGVQIYHLYGDGITGPSAALIRYQEGATVARHEHTGYEHILVLAGSQRDEHGTASAGTLSVNQPGTQHELASEAGCIVLAIYEKPVKFLAP